MADGRKTIPGLVQHRKGGCHSDAFRQGVGQGGATTEKALMHGRAAGSPMMARTGDDDLGGGATQERRPFRYLGPKLFSVLKCLEFRPETG